MRQPRPYFRKQKQAWYVQINGQRLSLGTDKKQAWQKYYEIMAGNRSLVESTATVAELFERYLDWVEENRKPGTYNKIKRHLTRFAKFIGLRTKIATLCGTDLSDWVESEKSWNSTTRNEGISCVVRCFNWAVGKKHIKSHTMAQVPDKPARKRREVVYSQDDWKKLRGYVKDQPFGDLLDFLWETGCRPLEARTMTADQIDLSNEVVIFQPSDAKDEQHERVIYLTDKAVEICNRNMKHEGPILLNTYGRPWTKDSINCRFQRLKKKLGKRAYAYAIRHTYATEGLLNGMDSLTLSQLMGHADTTQLSRTYSHLAKNPEFLKRQAKLLKKRA